MTPSQPPLQSLTLNDTVYETTLTRKFVHRKPYEPKDLKRLSAIIPGLILEPIAQAGDQIRRGQDLLILEAMKMQNHITAHDDVTVQVVHVAPGDTVMKGQLLMEFE